MFSPQFWTTHVGSLPYGDCEFICDHLARSLDVPNWPQFPRRTFLENMYVQFSAHLPGLRVDRRKEKVFFNLEKDISNELETFYQRYLAGDLDSFAIKKEYAHGFFEMMKILSHLPAFGTPEQCCVKGQITGPISFGLTVTDQDSRASLYNETLADVIVKNIAMCARWQVRELQKVRPEVIISVDEPYMAAFGSAFVSLERGQVITMLDEVFSAIHAEGGLAMVHCCANTDWSVLLATQVDILNLDAFGYIENLALYPNELRTFLDRDGSIAWGIIPNNEEILQLTAIDLAARLWRGVYEISRKARSRGIRIDPQEFANRSLITPSCGLGSTSVKIAENVIETLSQTAKVLRAEYG